MPERRRRLPVIGAALTVASMGSLLAGCATGPRPALGEQVRVGGELGQPTGVAPVDAVLQRLESAPTGPFTATYAITRKLGPVAATATVVRDGDTTSVTIGDTRFLDGATDLTCTVSTKTCEPGLREERIGELGGLTSGFWSSSTARYLRVSNSRRVGDPQATTETIAGMPVECVSLSVGPGTEQYCATGAGPLARIDRADYAVELTSWSDTADPAALAPPA